MGKTQKLKVFEAFSGIGAQSEALKRLGVSFEVVGWSDINKNAIKVYEHLNQGVVENSGDITKLESIPECDLLIYSSPCTDFSMAGLRRGGEKGSGTHSSLLWEVYRLLEDCRKRGSLPKFLLLENVLGLIQGKFLPFFNEWCRMLEDEFGYKTYSQVLDGKDFNVAQRRKRVFALSVLGESKPFHFPVGNMTSKTLVDVVEDVEEYLTYDKLNKLVNAKFIAEMNTLRGMDDLSGCLLLRHGYVGIAVDGELKNNVSKHLFVGVEFDNGDKLNSGQVVEVDGYGMLKLNGVDYRVRKYTSRELYRLMGWTEEKIDLIMELGLSRGIHSFLCGNSIVVPVLMGIFGEMLNQYCGHEIDWQSKVYEEVREVRRLF